MGKYKEAVKQYWPSWEAVISVLYQPKFCWVFCKHHGQGNHSEDLKQSNEGALQCSQGAPLAGRGHQGSKCKGAGFKILVGGCFIGASQRQGLNSQGSMRDAEGRERRVHERP